MPPSDRVRIRRVPANARYDTASVHRVLDRGRVAHVSFNDDGQPFCIPTLYARVGERVLIHGSSASRMVRRLSEGVPASLTVTLFDGWVLARSAFETAVNYESATVLGCFHAVAEERKLAVLEAFMEVVLPGRWAEARAPTRQELKATAILGLQIAEASVKARSGPPDDDESDDAELEIWAGTVPILERAGAPVPSPGLRAGIAPDASVVRLCGLGREAG
jgi:nitroimidazol reductase NimA-like FMN-containing flavoprotein (pyridoxamine 5'-phosphate oxidase superfamily)